MRFIAQEVREIMAKLGFRTFNEMVGRTDKLIPWKADRTLEGQRPGSHATFSISRKSPPMSGRYRQMDQDHGLEKSLDLTQLLDIASRPSSAAKKSAPSCPSAT